MQKWNTNWGGKISNFTTAMPNEWCCCGIFYLTNMKKSRKALLLFILIPYFSIAQQWYPMGIGVSNSIGNCWVTAIDDFNGQIIIGGHFKSSGTNTLNSIARWDGANWMPSSLGVWWSSQPDSTGFAMNFINYKSDFYCIGLFDGAGGTVVNDVNHQGGGITRWGNNDWDPLYPLPYNAGLNFICNSGVNYHNNLYLGGQFNLAADSSGTTAVRNIAKWNDTIFSSPCLLYSNAIGTYGEMSDNIVYDNKLIIAGGFNRIDNSSFGVFNFIASYNDTTWSPIGNGFNKQVSALSVYNNELYAAGAFTADGTNTQSLNHIAKWDGTQWQSVGTGLNDTVYDLYVDTVTNTLYAGGNFIQTGSGLMVNHIAAWNGTCWSGVGGGANDIVSAFYAKDSILYVGGSFTQVGNGISANHIAMYDYHNTSVGIKESTQNKELLIYPNPSHTYLTIQLSNNLTTQAIHIYNLVGEEVMAVPFVKPDGAVDISTLKEGMYFLEVLTEEGVLRKKFVKE